MKSSLIGLLVLSSFSTFAQERVFPLNLAASLLGTPQNVLKEVTFNERTKQWVVFDEASGGVQHVYLLPEDFKSKDKIITLVAPAQAGYRLVDNVTLKEKQIEILDSEKNLTIVKNEVPTYSQMRELAYEFYDVRATGWSFFENGIKNFPIYSKVKSIYDKCDVMPKEKKKLRCYKNEETRLAQELLSSTLINDQNNETLIEFLQNKHQKYYITGSLIRVYKDLLASEVLSEEYDWSEESVATGYSGQFLFHYTVDLASKITYYSPGSVWWKPSGLSVRYGYYPITRL